MGDAGAWMEMAFERERKYMLPPAGLPDLAPLGPSSPPRTLRLVATYFDTPELALLARGSTLRRRGGGDDDGWHLKSAAGDGARLERRMPTGASCRVPTALRDAVAESVTDRPLLPVLRLRTRRVVRQLFDDQGGVRAEVCVDRVQARLLVHPWTRSTWFEAEAELAPAGPPEVLEDIDRLLRAGGLTPAAHTSKAHRMLRAVPPDAPTADTAAGAVRGALADQLGRLQALEVAVGRDEPEALHDTRVALRRLRSILGAFGTLVAPAAEVRAVRDELRWAGRQLSGARDLEVLDALVGETLEAMPPELTAPVSAAWAARRDSGPATSDAAALDAIASPRWDALHARLVGLASGGRSRGRGDRRARKELRRRSRRVVAAVGRRVGRARDAVDDPSAWHEVRKAAKGARYAAEVVAGLPAASPADAAAPEGWREITDALGRCQDIAVARATLAELRPGGADAAAFDAVDAALAEQSSANLAEARRALGGN